MTIAVPAAPAPERTTRHSVSSFSTTRSALVSAARTTIAVPCWSSWKTGMSRLSRSRRSISKQRGAAMSSRLMPPKPGAIISTALTISSVSWLARQIGQASMLANRLNSAALPSITGSAAPGPMLPRPSTAEPSVTTATLLPLMVSRETSSGWLYSAMLTRPTPGRVGHRQVVAVLQRDLGVDLDLAADVEQEGPVADLVDLDAVDGVDRLLELVGVVGVAGRAGDVEDQPLTGRVDDVDRGDHAAGRGDRGRHRPDDPVVGRRVQAHGDRVRRRGDGHALSLTPARATSK